MARSSYGYSGTPLAKKLGIKQHCKLRLIHQPEYYFSLFTDLPEHLTLVNDGTTKADVIHYFAATSSQLDADMAYLRNSITENGSIWISWYKKSAKIETDVTENIIRDFALRNGLVDIKVCAVNDIWSGLKLVIPVKDRK